MLTLLCFWPLFSTSIPGLPSWKCVGVLVVDNGVPIVKNQSVPPQFSALKTRSYPIKEADWFSVTHEIGRVDPPFITEPIDQVISKNQPVPTLRLLNFSILSYEVWMLCNVSTYLSLLASKTWREWYEVNSKNSLLAWGGADWFPRKNFWIGAHGHFRYTLNRFQIMQVKIFH